MGSKNGRILLVSRWKLAGGTVEDASERRMARGREAGGHFRRLMFALKRRRGGLEAETVAKGLERRGLSC